VLGLEDLADEIRREDDRIFVGGRAQRDLAAVDEIGPEREVRPVLFEDAQRNDAGRPGPGHGPDEVRRGQLFVAHRQRLRILSGGLGSAERPGAESDDRGGQDDGPRFHGSYLLAGMNAPEI